MSKDKNKNDKNNNINNLTDDQLVGVIFQKLEEKEKLLKRKEDQLEKKANKPLRLNEAVSQLEMEELHYLFFTMADIVKYLADKEAMYNDINGQGCLQGAITIEDMAKQELINRMDEKFLEERLESYKEAENRIDDITDDHPEMAEHLSERLKTAKAEAS